MPTNSPVKGLFYMDIQSVGLISLVDLDYNLNLNYRHMITIIVFDSSCPLIISFPIGFLATPSASRYSGSLDYAFLACLIGPVFNLHAAFVCSASFCSVICRSPIVSLSYLKCCFGSGFVRKLTMFTSVLIFWTSSIFSVVSSQM